MDDRSAEARSKTMAAIKSTGTRLEIKFFLALSEKGITNLEQHPADVFGIPDAVEREVRVAIFLDSCFWHGCHKHVRMPQTNQAYWERKIDRNRRRDTLVKRQLEQEGWLVIRVWEHSVRSGRSTKWWATRIANLITSRKPTDLNTDP